MKVPDFITSWIESLRSRSFEEDLKVLIQLLAPTKSDVILDVGAGTGWTAGKLAEISEECFALEPNGSRVDYAKSHHPQVKAFTATANSIPFPSNYFDKLYVISAFHHFPDQEDALEEFRRVTKKGGWLLIHEFDPTASGKQLNFFERKIMRARVNFLRPSELEEMAGKHEFVRSEFRNGRRGYFILFRSNKSGEEASGWLSSDLKSEKASRWA
jgi:ubiquinone/menaquinone biosynthesis C-methylase UbiE